MLCLSPQEQLVESQRVHHQMEDELSKVKQVHTNSKPVLNGGDKAAAHSPSCQSHCVLLVLVGACVWVLLLK